MWDVKRLLHGYGLFWLSFALVVTALALMSGIAIALVLLPLSALFYRDYGLNRVRRQDGARLTYAQDHGEGGLWDCNLRDQSLFVSPRWRDLHGLTGPLPQSLAERIALAIPADQSRWQLGWDEFLAAADGVFHCDYRVTLADGVVRWLQDTARVVERDAAGAALRVIGTTKDISEHHAAEALALLTGNVFLNTAEAIVITDPQANILSVNPAFSAITGYAADEAIGQTPRLLKSDHNDADFYVAMWKTLLETGQWQGELWNRRQDGQAFLAWQTISAVRDHRGELQRFVSVFSDITELHRKDEHIRHQSFHDALTGLANRALLQDRLDHAIELAHREDKQLTVMFIDLDRFKVINDSLGHDAGDHLLVTVTNRLKDCMRRSDTIARLGGDEFVVVLTNISTAAEVADVAEKIIEAVNEPMTLKGHEIHIGASIGIALYPDDGMDGTALMKGADTAMYRAKDNGRNTFCFFDGEVDGAAVERLKLEAALRHALDRGEFELFYQPKINLKTGEVSGAEALIRWNSPERGLVPPDAFIPLAEETGLILGIGQWVLEEACRQMAEWRDRGLPQVKVAVNVSGRQFLDDDFCPRVARLLSHYRLGTDLLEVELTESTVMADPERAVRQLQALRDAGVSISVDDFGTGYSSLSYLKRLPLNTIKIDRSFVRHLDTQSDNAAIVRAILGLGAALGMSAIAEGVETDGEQLHLQGAGCDVAQGFKYSRPLPAKSFEEWLSNWRQNLSDFEQMS